MKPNLPSSLEISIGGYFSTSYSVTLKGNLLQYSAYEPGSPPQAETIEPSSDDWTEFYNELNTIGIWNWEEHYDANVCDGTQWTVSIRWGDRKCKVDGSNNYPLADGTPSDTCEPSETFERFLQAVSRLAGGRTFE